MKYLSDYEQCFPEYAGKVLCGWIDEGRLRYRYLDAKKGTVMQGSVGKKVAEARDLPFGNSDYPDKEIAKANKWAKRWRNGEEIELDCENCVIKFYCFTSRKDDTVID